MGYHVLGGHHSGCNKARAFAALAWRSGFLGLGKAGRVPRIWGPKLCLRNPPSPPRGAEATLAPSIFSLRTTCQHGLKHWLGFRFSGLRSSFAKSYELTSGVQTPRRATCWRRGFRRHLPPRKQQISEGMFGVGPFALFNPETRQEVPRSGSPVFCVTKSEAVDTAWWQQRRVLRRCLWVPPEPERNFPWE